MTELQILLTGISFGESPRWHDGRLWLCDWGAEELLAVDLDGKSELICRVPSFPFCIDWLPDGRLLIVSARERAVLTMRDDRSLATYADLSGLAERPPGNEIVTDGHGNAYVNGAGFDMMAGEAPAPGMVALVRPDGTATKVADGIAFPNGMAITPDGQTLIVADSYGGQLVAFDIGVDGSLTNRRTWAEVGDGVPDGICLDAEGACWYADVPNQRCSRVREGGEVLDEIELDRGCFACMLGGEEGRTLFMVTRQWHGSQDLSTGERSGQLLTTRAPAPHAGRP